MKIIQVIGHSGSGKTTFISRIVPELRKTGSTTTIKHLGHHDFSLEPGKDTTQFYESGAEISVGIDTDKSVYICRDSGLRGALDFLCDQGMAYAVVEGFKTLDLPSVVIGDLPSEHALFRNPEPGTIIHELSVFPEYHTKKSLEQELKNKWTLRYPDYPLDRQVMITVVAGVETDCGSSIADCMAFFTVACEISDDSLHTGNPALAEVVFRNWWQFGEPKELYCSSIAAGHEVAFHMVDKVLVKLKERGVEKGIKLLIDGWEPTR